MKESRARVASARRALTFPRGPVGLKAGVTNHVVVDAENKIGIAFALAALIADTFRSRGELLDMRSFSHEWSRRHAALSPVRRPSTCSLSALSRPSASSRGTSVLM